MLHINSTDFVNSSLKNKTKQNCKHRIRLKKHEITFPTAVALCSTGLVISVRAKENLRWATSGFSLWGHLATLCSMFLAKQSKNLI